MRMSHRPTHVCSRAGPVCTTEPFQADREGRDRRDRGHAEEGDLTLDDEQEKDPERAVTNLPRSSCEQRKDVNSS